MTSPEAAIISPLAHTAWWRGEIVATIELAVPIALTQLAQIAMMTTDLALIGRLDDHAVAAAALGHIVLFSTFMLCLGLASAVAPLASQAMGARDPRMVRRAVRVGLWAVLMIGAPLTALELQGDRLLMLFGQAPDTAGLAARYLDGLAWSMVPSCWFIALRNLMSALDRPQPALWITLVAIPSNAILGYALIYGEFGLPRLELLGAGLATTIVSTGMFIAAVIACHRRLPFRRYHVFAHFWRADWPLFGRLLIIGLPISGAFLLEYSLFAAAALLMGWIGTAALVGHQIALQVAAVVFMVPLGVGMAATVRVGQAAGRRDPIAAPRAGFVAIVLGIGFMCAMAVLVVTCRTTIPLIFLGARADAQTLAISAMLLTVGATFFIADGIQTIASGALRGLNDTRIPLLFAAASFWGVGFPCAYALAFEFGLGATGVWIGLSIGLGVYAMLLVSRFHALMRRHYLPAVEFHMTERLTIASLGHRGDAIANTPQGPLYVPYALPGEIVDVDSVPGHPDRRRLLDVVQASVDRIAPICPHFAICGGCALQHWNEARYRAWKRDLVAAALAQAGVPANIGDLVDAHGVGRRRATFHARTSGHDTLSVGFAAVNAHHIVPIDRCPILAPSLDGALPAAWAIAQVFDPLHKPLDIQVTATDGGLDIDVRGSGPLSSKIAGALARIAEQNRLARLTRHGELVARRATPTLVIGGATVELPPGAFLQATAEGEATLAREVINEIGRAKTVIDLFCGVGPFALRIARLARVSAYDSDDAAVAALAKAATAPALKPISAQRRDLFRQPLVAQELRADVVVFDPPRQGAEAQAREIAKSKVATVIAVSCNVATFARDAKILADGGYRLTSLTPVDQFRYSAHVEIVATFTR